MSEIKNLLFDLGGVIMNIRRENCVAALEAIGIADADEMLGLYAQKGPFAQLEDGAITADQFRNAMRSRASRPITDSEIDNALNCFLIGIPRERLRALERLHGKYNIYMLSNTNPIMFNSKIDAEFRQDGHDVNYYFDGLCLSYVEGCSKPGAKIFESVLERFDIRADETLFFDDSQTNIDAARAIGFNVQLVEPGTEFYNIVE